MPPSTELWSQATCTENWGEVWTCGFWDMRQTDTTQLKILSHQIWHCTGKGAKGLWVTKGHAKLLRLQYVDCYWGEVLIKSRPRLCGVWCLYVHWMHYSITHEIMTCRGVSWDCQEPYLSLSSFRNSCPYHRNLFSCSTEIMSSNPSLFLNSLLGILSCSFAPHVHLTILISACWSAISLRATAYML